MLVRTWLNFAIAQLCKWLCLHAGVEVQQIPKPEQTTERIQGADSMDPKVLLGSLCRPEAEVTCGSRCRLGRPSGMRLDGAVRHP